ncbi:MAG: GNAT family N-acetyltransferase [Caldilineaceae bacterium]
MGPTVVVDLTLSPEQQWHHVRADHRREISKARRAGIQCVRDESGCYFDDFIDIYYQTMQRVGATDGYFFDRQYFYRLREVLGDRLHLFVALKDDAVTAGSLFTNCNSIIQYHLSGTHDDYLNVAPSKFILDGVRQWGSAVGASALHLGGGVGAQEDSLFRFKAGFSRLTRRFKVWRMMSNVERYTALVEQRRRWSADNGYAAPNEHFFPTYRCPVVAK